MHRPIKEHLEDYLQHGTARPLPVEFEAHLESCKTCREEVGRMKSQAMLLRGLSVQEEIEPAAGFYARVVRRIEAQRPATIWDAFVEPLFVRRVAYTCVAVILVLFSYMVRTEPVEPMASTSPEFIMAVEPQSQLAGASPEQDRQAVLLTLATYQE